MALQTLDYIHEHAKAEFESYRAKVFLIEASTTRRRRGPDSLA